MSPWKTLLVMVVLLLDAPALAAQSVRGELVEAAGSRPVAGAFVVLVDASGRQVEGGLTDAEGRVLLRAPAPGRYTLRVRSERTSRRSGLSTGPFGSHPAEQLVEEGFVRAVGDSVDYHGPDAHVLLSNAFLDTHCFQVQDRSAEAGGLTGLAFEPVWGRGRPDVRGVLWMDPGTAELRHLEYSYTGLELRGLGLRELVTLRLREIESIEYLAPRSARARYGKDAEGGAVVIYTLGKGPHAKDRPTAGQ